MANVSSRPSLEERVAALEVLSRMDPIIPERRGFPGGKPPWIILGMTRDAYLRRENAGKPMTEQRVIDWWEENQRKIGVPMTWDERERLLDSQMQRALLTLELRRVKREIAAYKGWETRKAKIHSSGPPNDCSSRS